MIAIDVPGGGRFWIEIAVRGRGRRTPRRRAENILFGEFDWGCGGGRLGPRLRNPQKSLGGRGARFRMLAAESGGSTAA